PSIEKAVESGMEREAANRGALNQAGNLFKSQRLQESGAKAAEFESRVSSMKVKTPTGSVSLGTLFSLRMLVLAAKDSSDRTAATDRQYERQGVGPAMAVGQGGKAAAKATAGWLWAGAGGALALTLATGGMASPLAAAAIGAIFVTVGTTATNDLIDQ